MAHSVTVPGAEWSGDGEVAGGRDRLRHCRFNCIIRLLLALCLGDPENPETPHWRLLGPTLGAAGANLGFWGFSGLLGNTMADVVSAIASLVETVDAPPPVPCKEELNQTLSQGLMEPSRALSTCSATGYWDSKDAFETNFQLPNPCFL